MGDCHITTIHIIDVSLCHLSYLGLQRPGSPLPKNKKTIMQNVLFDRTDCLGGGARGFFIF